MKLPIALPKQLTRLQFYGLALSAFWAVAVAFYVRQTEMPRAQQYAMTAYYTCTEHKAETGDRNLDDCLNQVGTDWDDWMNRQWGRIARLALIPMALAWLTGLAIARLYRRNKKPPG